MQHLYNYLDELLVVQSKAADRHNHKGVLGAVREEFIKTIISERLDWLKERVQTGEIVSDNKYYGQQDILIRKEGAVNTALGGQSLLDVKDAAAIIEIKTNAKLTEITKFDKVAQKLKDANPNLVTGFLCYKLNGTKKTVLKRAGYSYDKELETYEPSTEPEYEAIDFIISLDEEFDRGEEKSFYLQRDQSSKFYSFTPSGPFSEYLLLEVKRADQNAKEEP
ncbi:DUF6602 domain-containing protein [Algibacillus agarilyticus]|uniref:DUF6602 domain-containing protein n=1 Tax=Algibacillus agarilyticus TaxID=2234133 RepID=UPI000DD0694D|nr:DUF6602 domain-containing protein [Algibacillus agarilyticus]